MSLARVVLLLLILFQTTSIANGRTQRRRQQSIQETDKNDLRYQVGLSEPLQSTLEWDYDENDPTKLVLRWKITMNKGQAAILAFSNYDLDTDGLDMFIFRDEQLYNVFTDDQSWIMMPKDGMDPSLMLQDSDCVEYRKQLRCTIEILRPLDTCDEEKRNYIIDRGTTQLLTGVLSASDFQNLQRKKTVKIDIERMNLTLQRVQLLKPRADFKPIADSDPHLDFLNQNVTIPDVETTYWCTRFKLPSFIMKESHHIVRFDGVVSPQSDGVVHHMELFHCDVSPSTEIPEYNQACTSEQKPMGLTPCRRVIGAWALGATNFTYPDETGGSIGGPGTSPYLVLEVHFNNPYLKKGIVDQSGIRFYYTKKLRKYPAGIMEVGLEYNAKNSVPPRATAFRVSGYCAKECTQVALPPKGIIIFASQLHTHLNGRQTFTRIIKKDGRIETLNIDRHYSPHFQEIRLLPRPVRVEPGDAIIHTCIYNTEIHDNMTFGGYGIRDEMCVNYMHYYPRSNLELCKTSVGDEELDRFFEKMNEYDFDPTSNKKSVEENYQSIRWSPLKTQILQEFYEIAPIHLSCNGSDGDYIPKFDGNRGYLPVEPVERDVPLDTAALSCQ